MQKVNNFYLKSSSDKLSNYPQKQTFKSVCKTLSLPKFYPNIVLWKSSLASTDNRDKIELTLYAWPFRPLEIGFLQTLFWNVAFFFVSGKNN